MTTTTARCLKALMALALVCLFVASVNREGVLTLTFLLCYLGIGAYWAFGRREG
jgi:hypothetical protein